MTKQHAPQVIGLTGGIGSGKSTLSEIFLQHGIPTIDSDTIARQIVEPGTPGLDQLIKAFGKEILHTNHTLNRAKLRTLIFNDPEAKQRVEGILHPRIKIEMQRQIGLLKQSKNNDKGLPFILVAIPLLVEQIKQHGGKPSYIDEIWVIDTPEIQQIERACQRDHVKKSQIKQIIDQQATREQRLAIADLVIHNNGNIDELKQQVETIMRDFQIEENH